LGGRDVAIDHVADARRHSGFGYPKLLGAGQGCGVRRALQLHIV
jgi:hypothetical protein